MSDYSENFIVSAGGSLRAALPGMLFAVLTILFGFSLGIGFGLNEDFFKSRMADSAAEVIDTVYGGDEAKSKAICDKSWTYLKRAHMHAGAIGTSAVGLIALVVLLGSSTWWTRAISLALGLGGFGYLVFWLIAGFRAPGMGSTGAAKESLAWLAMPSSGLVLLGTVGVAVLIVLKWVRPNCSKKP